MQQHGTNVKKKCVFVCLIWFSQSGEIRVLNNVNWVIFIMDKGCVLCEIQTKILYTVGTNVRLQDVCDGSGAEGRFRDRSGHVGWWAHCHRYGFSPVRYSPLLPFHRCSTFGFLSKAACNRTSWQNQQMWCLPEIDERLERRVLPFYAFSWDPVVMCE
jgi:hypothetical protein